MVSLGKQDQQDGGLAMKKILLGSVALLGMVAGPAAMAADMRVKAPVRPPPPVYAFSWTGCYIGGHIGRLWIEKDFALSSVGTPFGAIVFANPVGLGGHDANDWLAGVQGGCDYQFAGGFVIGIAADYAWTDASGSHVDPVLALTTLESTTKSLASVTGRLGYAWDRFLGYVKGGGAWERDNYLWFVTAAPGLSLSASETRSGWTVGIGGEYAFSDWISGFVEYNYYDFGTSAVAFQAGGVAFNFDIEERKSVLKLGLNLRFGAGPAPVAARY
jgi:outer membrane immunogenic protein